VSRGDQIDLRVPGTAKDVEPSLIALQKQMTRVPLAPGIGDDMQSGLSGTMPGRKKYGMLGRPYVVKKTIDIDQLAYVEGVGIDSGVTAGSIIDNTYADITGLRVIGPQRIPLKDFGIRSHAASRYAVAIAEGAYARLDHLVADCDGGGYGGFLIGDDDAETQAALEAVEADSWQPELYGLRADNYSYAGIRVNSTGHTGVAYDCSPRSNKSNTLTITDATETNPVEFTTSTNHGWKTSRIVQLAGLPGDFGSNLNGRHFRIAVTAVNKFTINVDGSGYAAYTSGGSAKGGAHGLLCNFPNFNAIGGQYGANNAGGVNMLWFNLRGALLRGGGAQFAKFENVDAGEYAIVTDGYTDAWESVIHQRVGGNFTNGITGTLCRFGRAINCGLYLPVVEAPGGTGTLCEWDANSVGCWALVDYNAARSPVVVHANAIGALKWVRGIIPRADVTNITTAANLTTVLEGVDVLQERWTHNGTAWDKQLQQIANDGVFSFTPPTTRGILEISTNNSTTEYGFIAYCTDSGGASTDSLGAGSNLARTTGILTGTTGGAGVITVSAHTNGLLYIQNRRGGTRNVTVRLRPVRYGN
jgi:hypothetical protein